MMTLNTRLQIRCTLLVLGGIAVSAGAQLAIEPIIRESGESTKPPLPFVPTPRTRQHVEGQRADILEFKEQDRLQGTLLSVDTEKGVLTWEHPAALEPIEFARRDLRRVSLGSRLAPRTVEDAVAVRLTNGDLIFGRVTSIGEAKVRIDTWYAGRLDIERSMVSRISRCAAMTGLVDDGPDSIAHLRTEGKEDTDVLVLANNDQISGRVQALRDGRLQVETSPGSSSAPWTEVQEIIFARAHRRTAAAGGGSVVAEFTGEGAVTLNQVKIEAGEIRGTSACFGALVAPLSAFSSLSFNDPDPDPEPETAAEEEPSLPPIALQIEFVGDRGISVMAESIRFEDLVRAVFEKMVELEQPKVIPTFSMSRDLADSSVSINIQNEMSRRQLFAALEKAGNCTMVVADDGNQATFKEK